MQVHHEDSDLNRLETDIGFDVGYDRAIVKAFRMRMQLIRSAVDTRAFYAMSSLHFEKLKGSRQDQYSMRLNSQWRLILKMKDEPSGKVIVVVSISDYH